MGEQGAIIGTYAPQRRAEAVDRYEIYYLDRYS